MPFRLFTILDANSHLKSLAEVVIVKQVFQKKNLIRLYNISAYSEIPIENNLLLYLLLKETNLMVKYFLLGRLLFVKTVWMEKAKFESREFPPENMKHFR